jgi:hypothetical protein
MDEDTLEITLSFRRKGSNEKYTYTFSNNETLYPILEKLENFLTQMDFVLDGKRLDLVQPHNYTLDRSSNITAFPPPKLLTE